MISPDEQTVDERLMRIALLGMILGGLFLLAVTQYFNPAAYKFTSGPLMLGMAATLQVYRSANTVITRLRNELRASK